MRCYCSICRKTAAGGGYAVNIMAQAETLTVRGEDDLAIYQAVSDGRESDHRRLFCRKCGSHLWADHARWPQWIWPLASAIDTELPKAPESVNMMLEFAAPWCAPAAESDATRFDGYPDESIEAWHRARGLYDEG